MHDTNPLLAAQGHPHYASIRAEHVEPAVRQRIDEYRRLIDERLSDAAPPTWESVVAPMDDADERLENAARPADHLVHVLGQDAMREADRGVKPLLAEFGTQLSQDVRLWRALTAIREQGDTLTPSRRKVLDDDLRELRLAGVHLPEREKTRLREINVEQSKLSVQFAQNVTDATDAFRLVLERDEDVAGLPASLLEAAREQALRDDPKAPEKRWSFTLHAPSLMPFLTYQRNRGLREAMYRANVTRASSGPHDNGPLIGRTLALRAEEARLLGFANFAEMALVRRMAKSPAEVHAFLTDLAARARPHAARERDELARFARERDGLSSIERWDAPYYRELLRSERYDFSEEEVRAYFPIDRVMDGLRAVVRRLYGALVVDRTKDAVFETWHPDVRVLEFRTPEGAVIGHVFADFFARKGKQSGAWVSGCAARKRRSDGSIQLPSAYLVCNFPAPTAGSPSLLRHEEVRTLFHEFGHALHHVFSTTDERQVSGTRGVPRDGVELPSQFFENWIWHEEPLAMMSGHVETGAPLPKALLAKMLQARNFMKAVDIARQMEFALFDLEIHTAGEPLDERGVHEVIESVRRRVAVFPAPAYDRFENGFLHLFAGGYAAGYYGYAWAEVLAADAFARFEDEGIWSPAAARDFRDKLLARGSSAEFMDLYVDFRGKKPTPDALLRSSGLA